MNRPGVIPGVPLRFTLTITGEVAGLDENTLAARLVSSISWNAWLSQYMLPMQVEIGPAPLSPGGPQLVKPGG